MKDPAPDSADSAREIGIGLFGINRHQFHPQVLAAASAKLTAVAAFPEEKISTIHPKSIRRAGLAELPGVPKVELIIYRLHVVRPRHRGNP